MPEPLTAEDIAAIMSPVHLAIEAEITAGRTWGLHQRRYPPAPEYAHLFTEIIITGIGKHTIIEVNTTPAFAELKEAVRKGQIPSST
jgi:hypothetical protein